MSKLFLFGDTHFNHEEILTHESNTRGKLFKSIEEHDNILIDNINSTVGKNDILIITGDFAFANREMFIEYINRIRCQRLELLKGSHDRGETFSLSVGFTRFYKYPILINNVLVSHEPEYIAKNSRFINAHSHTHSKSYNFGKIKYDISPDNYHWNLSAESNDMQYKPVNIDKIFEYADRVL